MSPEKVTVPSASNDSTVKKPPIGDAIEMRSITTRLVVRPEIQTPQLEEQVSGMSKENLEQLWRMPEEELVHLVHETSESVLFNVQVDIKRDLLEIPYKGLVELLRASSGSKRVQQKTDLESAKHVGLLERKMLEQLGLSEKEIVKPFEMSTED